VKPPRPSKEQLLLFNILKGDLPTSLDGIDTEIFLDLLRRHRLIPIAHAILPLLVDDEREGWKNMIRNQVIRSLQYTSVLEALVRELRKMGLECIALKGPSLAQSLYGDVTKRQYRDLDILIKRSEIKLAVEAAKKLGFSQYYPKPGLSTKKLNLYFRSRKEIGMINGRNGIIIEIHTGLYFHHLLKESEAGILYESLENIEINGTSIRCMSLENTFLYLTYHGGWHLYFRLFWLRDVAFAISQWDMDHQRILSRSKQLGIDRLLGLSLLLIEDLFQVTIPREYHDYLNSNSLILNRLKSICSFIYSWSEKPNFKVKLLRLVFFLSVKRGLKYRISVLSNPFHHWYVRKFLE